MTSDFSFSHIAFYPFGELSAIFVKFEIVVCILFHLGRVQNLLFEKGLNNVTICSSILTLYYTTLKNKLFVNIVSQGENAGNWKPAFAPYPKMFSTIPETNLSYL